MGGQFLHAKPPDGRSLGARHHTAHGPALHLMAGKGGKGAFRLAAGRNSGLRPVESQRLHLRRAKAVHGAHHVEQKSPSGPSVLGNGREHIAEAQATDGERFDCRKRSGVPARSHLWRIPPPLWWRRLHLAANRRGSFRGHRRTPGRRSPSLHCLVSRFLGPSFRPTHPHIDAKSPEPSMFCIAMRHRQASVTTAGGRPGQGSAFARRGAP